ncbi:hypothetical protein HDU76_010795 [Blyttiomyces sp. JEL0837]|nr:hypothetical protein HDU76_010795 [Blyttiomyces sp. JEL0837]
MRQTSLNMFIHAVGIVLPFVFAVFPPNILASDNIVITLNATDFPPPQNDPFRLPNSQEIAMAVAQVNEIRRYYDAIAANNSVILKALNITMDQVISAGPRNVEWSSKKAASC